MGMGMRTSMRTSIEGGIFLRLLRLLLNIYASGLCFCTDPTNALLLD
jgi:hypothetical protein